MKVLLCEDTEELRELMGNALRAEGFEVVEACNGMEGLRKFKLDTSIEAVVTDFQMPLMTGRQLIIEIKALAPRVPIIMWSGSDDPHIEGILFLTKLVTARQVAKALKEVA